MKFEELVSKLSKGLLHPLPGKASHLTMSPSPLDLRRFEIKLPNTHNRSAVLLLFYPEEGEAFFPLIKRPIYKGVHSGQIALPGGKYEELDGDLSKTALRESYEEVGVDISKVELVGKLTDLFIPTSNFLVSPYLGVISEKPQFVPEKKEVYRILLTPFRTLQSPEILKRRELLVGDKFKLDTPYFELDGETVWGATAMILQELLQIIKNADK